MNLRDIGTVFWRDWTVLNRQIVKFVISRMVGPVLYLIAFGWGLGRVAQTSGGSYLDFIVPGIMALNAMNISFSAVGSSVNMSRFHHKTLEEYLIAPISPVSYVSGKILAGALRGLISCGVIFILAYFFGANFIVNMWFILVLMLTCFLFAALGLVVAMLIRSHEDMGNFATYVLLPMSFLCSTFFSADRLPGICRVVIELLPLTHATYALRSIDGGGGLPLISFGALSLYAIALTGVGVWTMKKVKE